MPAVGRMPVTRGVDRQTERGELLREPPEWRHDALAVGYRQGASRTEVVLDVHDEQRLRRVGLHPAIVSNPAGAIQPARRFECCGVSREKRARHRPVPADDDGRVRASRRLGIEHVRAVRARHAAASRIPRRGRARAGHRVPRRASIHTGGNRVPPHRSWSRRAPATAFFNELLPSFRFEGDVWAMREGEPAFAGEPMLRVTAAPPQAQLVETALLAIVNFQTLIASKAARIVAAAAGRPMLEFGTRRAHGLDAALYAARAAFVAGCAGTSNVEAGLPVRHPYLGHDGPLVGAVVPNRD